MADSHAYTDRDRLYVYTLNKIDSSACWRIAPLVLVRFNEVIPDLIRNPNELILQDWVIGILVQVILSALQLGKLRLNVLVLGDVWELEGALVQIFGIDLDFINLLVLLMLRWKQSDALVVLQKKGHLFLCLLSLAQLLVVLLPVCRQFSKRE